MICELYFGVVIIGLLLVIMYCIHLVTTRTPLLRHDEAERCPHGYDWDHCPECSH